MGKKTKNTRFKVFKITIITLILLFVFGTIATMGVVLAMVKTAPPLDVNKVLSLNEPSVIYNDSGQFMDTVISDINRKVVSFKDMPQDLKDAFIAIEDERFKTHSGIDIKRILGSTLSNVSNKITGKRGLQGASTITQQLVRNTMLTNEVKLKRKVQEAYLALQLEKHLSKDQILEAYMNTIALGGPAYGVEAASIQYFNKSVSKLNLLECAFIAGLTQSPSVFYNAVVTKKNTSSYINRTKSVLSKLLENGYISQDEYNKALSDLNNNKLTFNLTTQSNSLKYEWFSREVIKKVKQDLMAQYHIDEDEANRMIMYGGLKIYSTMNKDMQEHTQTTLDNMDSILGMKSKYVDKIAQPQASAVIMDYHTGEVKSIVGGRGNQPPLSFNRATQFYRAAGSSIKPLSVYGPAIDSKLATAATIYDDAPVPAGIGQFYPDNGKPYSPSNSPAIYEGPMTLREGLTKSKNVISVRIEHQLGLSTGADYARKFGLKIDKNTDESSMAAMSLGQLGGNPGVSGTNTLAMAAAYGVFGNGGMRVDPIIYTKVLDRTGKTILESKFNSTKVLSPQAAYIMYDLLRGPVSGVGGTGTAANFSPMAHGKTGTTNASIDLWFTGLTPYYSGAVWIGKDDHGSFNENYTFGKYIGSNDAAKLWGIIMKDAHKSLAYKEIPMPSGVVQVPICTVTGKIPTDACPSTTIRNELFIEGTVPTGICDYHVTVPKEETNKADDKIDKDAKDNINKDKTNKDENSSDPNNNSGDNANTGTSEDNTDSNGTPPDNTNSDDSNIIHKFIKPKGKK
ncbi:transglycosylase domain-containing protein [Clostridium peptidivorans]|uniref:transglycosylase domain-containing protein n=1 Tax=Clostridium peptidivorans TaxID=100174 RepID=UPI000BE40E5F|nr:PBP1A family penicillin-binding protein [Clostridium peptidivorans]